MPLAATLVLDEAGAAPGRAMWQALATAGLARGALELGYPPPLTLTMWGAAPEPTALAALAEGWAALPLRLAGFGIFPGGVLWLAPVVTAELLARHAALHQALPGLAPHPHYAPGAWVPHVTLSTGVAVEAALPVV